MKLGDRIFSEKKEAGIALLEQCQKLKQPDRAVWIGEYQGFSMEMTYHTMVHSFTIQLKGQLSHEVEIGEDALGNLRRMNHVLEQMPEELAEVQEDLSYVKQQLETAKIEVTKPFLQEQELKEKLKRLQELNAKLNLDEKGERNGGKRRADRETRKEGCAAKGKTGIGRNREKLGRNGRGTRRKNKIGATGERRDRKERKNQRGGAEFLCGGRKEREKRGKSFDKREITANAAKDEKGTNGAGREGGITKEERFKRNATGMKNKIEGIRIGNREK